MLFELTHTNNPGETLNFISLVMQFYLVDVFLNNKFRWFGMEVVEYYSWSFRDRQNRDLMLRSAAMQYFPFVHHKAIFVANQEPALCRVSDGSVLQHSQRGRGRK